MPGGCNPADVLFKLAHARGIKAPVFEQVLLYTSVTIVATIYCNVITGV